MRYLRDASQVVILLRRKGQVDAARVDIAHALAAVGTGTHHDEEHAREDHEGGPQEKVQPARSREGEGTRIKQSAQRY